jgi:hypothetical protein
VHAAVDDRRHRVHQRLVRAPVLAAALLVQVHAHDQRLAERLRDLDELLPRRVHAQDVADDDLAAVLLREVGDLLRLLDGLGQRLLAEHVRTALQRHLGDRRVRVRIGVDRHHVRLRRRVGHCEVGERRHAAELGRQSVAGGRGAGDEPHQLEVALQAVVGAGVGGAHVAAADDEHTQGIHGGRSTGPVAGASSATSWLPGPAPPSTRPARTPTLCAPPCRSSDASWWPIEARSRCA